MDSVHPKIVIYFKKDGALKNVEITWDSQEKMTHISDIRKIIYEKKNRKLFGIPRNTNIKDIILKDFNRGKNELFDHEIIDRNLVLLLEIRTSSMNENVFSNVKRFLGENDQFNAILAQRKQIPELEKGVNCIEMCARVRKYLHTYKRVWKRIGWDWRYDKFNEDYFDNISFRNDTATSIGQPEIIKLPHIDEVYDVNDFWKGLHLRLINFGMIIMSENTSESRLEKENKYWNDLLKDNDDYWKTEIGDDDIDNPNFNPNPDEGIENWHDDPYELGDDGDEDED